MFSNCEVSLFVRPPMSEATRPYISARNSRTRCSGRAESASAHRRDVLTNDVARRVAMDHAEKNLRARVRVWGNSPVRVWTDTGQDGLSYRIVRVRSGCPVRYGPFSADTGQRLVRLSGPAVRLRKASKSTRFQLPFPRQNDPSGVPGRV
jgi:hypothetical protein